MTGLLHAIHAVWVDRPLVALFVAAVVLAVVYLCALSVGEWLADRRWQRDVAEALALGEAEVRGSVR